MHLLHASIPIVWWGKTIFLYLDGVDDVVIGAPKTFPNPDDSNSRHRNVTGFEVDHLEPATGKAVLKRA